MAITYHVVPRGTEVPKLEAPKQTPVNNGVVSPQNPLGVNSFNNQVITIPFTLFCSLLFNKRDSFLEDADMFMRERMPVSKTIAELLRIWDKDCEHVKVLPPRSEFNDTSEYVAYTIEAWRTSEVYFNKLKESQKYSQDQITLREEKIKELAHNIEQDAGFDAETALQLARLKVMSRAVTWCKIYRVDISMLSEEHTKKTRIL